MRNLEFEASIPHSDENDQDAREDGFTPVLTKRPKATIGEKACMFACVHFCMSLVLGLFIILAGMGQGLSDAYHGDSLPLRIAEVSLRALQAPVVFLHWLTVKADPGHTAWKPAIFLGLGMLWSILLGCSFYLVGSRVEKFKQRKMKESAGEIS